MTDLGGGGKLLRGFGDSEIDELERAGVRDQQILRRDVAMDDLERIAVFVAGLVGRVQAPARLLEQMNADGNR
jgi:hypothetical protein